MSSMAGHIQPLDSANCLPDFYKNGSNENVPL